MNKLLAALLVSFSTLALADSTPPTKATEKPKVLKPCKEGQTAAKDNCHEVKAATAKKAEPKKAEPKKDEKKK